MFTMLMEAAPAGGTGQRVGVEFPGDVRRASDRGGGVGPDAGPLRLSAGVRRGGGHVWCVPRCCFDICSVRRNHSLHQLRDAFLVIRRACRSAPRTRRAFATIVAQRLRLHGCTIARCAPREQRRFLRAPGIRSRDPRSIPEFHLLEMQLPERRQRMLRPPRGPCLPDCDGTASRSISAKTVRDVLAPAEKFDRQGRGPGSGPCRNTPGSANSGAPQIRNFAFGKSRWSSAAARTNSAWPFSGLIAADHADAPASVARKRALAKRNFGYAVRDDVQLGRIGSSRVSIRAPNCCTPPPTRWRAGCSSLRACRAARCGMWLCA